ncbi:cation transporter [Sphingomonas sp. LHG3443-2]|jgi:Co/Zn/Cd efflux system component|uniref:cation transporter n=1 Tax=Sphingomonas sp. LHG3443-2 TaxID=2804639 RepID=UPI003CF30ABB
MSESNLDLGSADKRKTLWIVLALNVAIAVGFFATGVFASSSALIANGLDNSSDALVYALSLLALTRGPVWKRGAARVSGILLLIFAVGVLVDAGRRYVAGSDPIGTTMMIMAVIAAGVNLWCLILLKRVRQPDVNMRAATTFSFNDFISNGGILVGGGLVLWLGQNWPDLVVAVGIAVIAFKGGIEILHDAHHEAKH